MVFILNLFLTSIYSSGLSSIMTIPLYEKPIDTIYQFYESGLYWGALGDAWTFSLKDANDVSLKGLIHIILYIIRTS
nr:unnamed protein product [Callosobruchus chinensis]